MGYLKLATFPITLLFAGKAVDVYKDKARVFSPIIMEPILCLTKYCIHGTDVMSTETHDLRLNHTRTVEKVSYSYSIG